MLAVDRKFFAPFNPYQDSPQPIGSNVTISAPHMRMFYFLKILIILHKI